MRLATNVARTKARTGSDVAGQVTSPEERIAKEQSMYQKPEVKRFGSLRELTQGGGPAGGGDATNVYHRS